MAGPLPPQAAAAVRFTGFAAGAIAPLAKGPSETTHGIAIGTGKPGCGLRRLRIYWTTHGAGPRTRGLARARCGAPTRSRWASAAHGGRGPNPTGASQRALSRVGAPGRCGRRGRGEL